jgi:hypothetical protein
MMAPPCRKLATLAITVALYLNSMPSKHLLLFSLGTLCCPEVSLVGLSFKDSPNAQVLLSSPSNTVDYLWQEGLNST